MTRSPPIRPKAIWKLVAAGAVCLALAGLLGLQALSSIATRKSPEQSVQLMAANGLAHEQLAFREFQAGVSDGQAPDDAARSAAARALQGLSHDPLAPKSYALLALAEQDPAKRAGLLEGALALNRRDITLLSAALQDKIAAEDYRGVVETLDWILRVHPEYSDEFFAVLRDALAVPEAAALFPSILTGGSPWHNRFLLYVVGQDEALQSLASIRSDLAIEDQGFDATLIRGLARTGDVAGAAAIYELVASGAQPAMDEEGVLSWAADYPPFDWFLVDENDFRSQPSRDGERLELYARSGQGGLIARRIIERPSDSFLILARLDSEAAGRESGVRLQVRCEVGAPPLLDAALQSGPNSIAVTAPQAGCPQVVIDITARARRGEPTLRAELTKLQIEPSQF